MKLNMRSYDEGVRQHMLGAVRRICRAEADASAAPKPPEFTTLSSYPLTENDPDATARVVAAFREQLGDDRVLETPPGAASEDFSVFGRSWDVPYVFWFVGGTDPETWEQARQPGRCARSRAIIRRASHRCPIPRCTPGCRRCWPRLRHGWRPVPRNRVLRSNSRRSLASRSCKPCRWR